MFGNKGNDFGLAFILHIFQCFILSQENGTSLCTQEQLTLYLQYDFRVP